MSQPTPTRLRILVIAVLSDGQIPAPELKAYTRKNRRIALKILAALEREGLVFKPPIGPACWRLSKSGYEAVMKVRGR